MTPWKDYTSHWGKNCYASAQRSVMLTVSVHLSALGVTSINMLNKPGNIGACTIMHEPRFNGSIATRTISARLRISQKKTWKCLETLRKSSDLVSDQTSFHGSGVRVEIQIRMICLALVCMSVGPSLWCIVVYTNHVTVYQVSWLRAKARYQRWAEEIHLVKLEMQWTINWFRHQERCWEERSECLLDEEREEGLQSYCHKQMALWRALGDDAKQRFSILEGPQWMIIWITMSLVQLLWGHCILIFRILVYNRSDVQNYWMVCQPDLCSHALNIELIFR